MKRLQIELGKVLLPLLKNIAFLITDTLFDPLEVARIHPVRKFCEVTNSAWKIQ